MIRDELQSLVDEQAEEDGLWAVYPVGMQRISEAYLQQELRRLHNAIEVRPAAPVDVEKVVREWGKQIGHFFHDYEIGLLLAALSPGNMCEGCKRALRRPGPADIPDPNGMYCQHCTAGRVNHYTPAEGEVQGE